MPQFNVTSTSQVLTEDNAKRKAITLTNLSTVAADVVMVRLGKSAPPTTTDADYALGAGRIQGFDTLSDGDDIKGRIQVISASGNTISILWKETIEATPKVFA